MGDNEKGHPGQGMAFNRYYEPIRAGRSQDSGAVPVAQGCRPLGSGSTHTEETMNGFPHLPSKGTLAA